MSCPFCSAELPGDRRPGEKPEPFACESCFNPFVAVWEANVVACRPLARAQDIRQLAPDGSIGGAVLEQLPNSIENLPVLPEISRRVLAMVSDPDVSMSDLAAVIREDPVIALKVMRLANSAVYGGLHEVRDLNAACARLGMRNIANAVQAVANGNLYITGDKRLREVMRRLWRHSLAVSHSASELGGLLALPRPEVLFLAGLIHDVGKVVLLEMVSGNYRGAIGKLRESPELFAEVLDRFHPLIGLHVSQRWGLPPEFNALVYCHHDPGQAPNDETLPMAHAVCLANDIAQAEGYTVTGKAEEKFLTSHASARYLNLTDIKLAALRVDLSDTLQALMESFAQEEPA